MDMANVKVRVEGSSPRVRGKHDVEDRRRECLRLIPACAGKTAAREACPRAPGAHPRVCGENAIDEIDYELSLGSSPRVRGKLSFKAVQMAGDRLIPACAGKTPRGRCSLPTYRAHPRVCGENRRGV